MGAVGTRCWFAFLMGQTQHAPPEIDAGDIENYDAADTNYDPAT